MNNGKGFLVYKGIDDKRLRRQIEIRPFKEPLEYLQGLVGGYLEHYIIDDKLDANYIDMWINEEGKLIEGLQPTFALLHDGELYDVIFGNCVFSKYDDEGNTLGLDEFEINRVIAFLNDCNVVGLTKKDGSTVPVLAVNK